MDKNTELILAQSAPPANWEDEEKATNDLDLLREERVWLVGTVERLRAGDFDLAGEPWRWVPPADDPGRQMEADRERYRRLLAQARETTGA